MITSDLHLGHNNIHKFRTKYSTAEDHHNEIFENLAVNINKADSLILLGDIAFDKYWLNRLSDINRTLFTGHLHHKKVQISEGAGYSNYTGDDPMYFNACVEHTDYKPISFAEIMERVNSRG